MADEFGEVTRSIFEGDGIEGELVGLLLPKGGTKAVGKQIDEQVNCELPNLL